MKNADLRNRTRRWTPALGLGIMIVLAISPLVLGQNAAQQQTPQVVQAPNAARLVSPNMPMLNPAIQQAAPQIQQQLQIAPQVRGGRQIAPPILNSVQPAEARPRRQPPEPRPINPDEPRIQIAILLDTSGSMSGLIDQARAHLWSIVNEFEGVTRNGVRPRLEVALYEYGKSSLPAEEGYIQMLVPLTEDLDLISEELFILETNGGSEYCGQVIARSIEELGWDEAENTLKTIFIAGNEPFTQGPIDYKDACRAAADSNVTVSTIHCGDHNVGVDTQWADGARLADGSYVSIDHNQSVAGIEAPQDQELAELSAKINSTYVAYGSRESQALSMRRQSAQDSNALGLAPSVAASRAVTKSSGLYRNSHWDLIDAMKGEDFDLGEVPEEELPEEMREMSEEERVTFLEEKAAERTEIQERIQELAQARDAYVAEQRIALAESAPAEPAFDAAIMESVREQAEEFELEFPE
jgi:hypothetical protein